MGHRSQGDREFALPGIDYPREELRTSINCFARIGARVLFALALSGCAARRTTPPTPPVAPDIHDELQTTISRHYDELFNAAPDLKFTPEQLKGMRQHLSDTEEYCKQRAEAKSENYKQQIKLADKELEAMKKKPDENRRHELHCQIQELRSFKAQTDLLADQLIPTAFLNNKAKIDVLQNWPPELKNIQQQIASGAYRDRRWGNVEEIGFRTIEKDQKDDIKRGEDALRQLRQMSAMPKELDNKEIQDYVNTIAQRLAANSDLEVPLKVIVLDSREVNAFALPGGFLFVERGLLEEADNESQLAGVIAHEMAHVVARHSWRLYKKAMISSIFYQAAQIAVLVATGGASGIGTYYALQYGFYGLGFALDLNLLGVSRDYELEADQLGMQYAWKAGYDPQGFIRFFDKVASKHGYAIGMSWFRTHPPFYERMVASEREMMYLPKKEAWIFQTHKFEQMKTILKPIAQKSNAEQDANRPSLLSKEEKCDLPEELYKPEEPIENICAGLGQPSSPSP